MGRAFQLLSKRSLVAHLSHHRSGQGDKSVDYGPLLFLFGQTGRYFRQFSAIPLYDEKPLPLRTRRRRRDTEDHRGESKVGGLGSGQSSRATVRSVAISAIQDCLGHKTPRMELCPRQSGIATSPRLTRCSSQ